MDVIYEEHGSDWSHQVSAVGTTRWLQRDQTLYLSVKGVACETKGCLVGTLTWPVTHRSSTLCEHMVLSSPRREDQHQCLDTTQELRSTSSSERWEEEDKTVHRAAPPPLSHAAVNFPQHAPTKALAPPPHSPHPVLHPPAFLWDLISFNLLGVTALHEAERKPPVCQLGRILNSKRVNRHAQCHSNRLTEEPERACSYNARNNFRSKLWNTVSVINELFHPIQLEPACMQC